jgi:hypothetical protein
MAAAGADQRVTQAHQEATWTYTRIERERERERERDREREHARVMHARTVPMMDGVLRNTQPRRSMFVASSGKTRPLMVLGLLRGGQQGYLEERAHPARILPHMHFTDVPNARVGVEFVDAVVWALAHDGVVQRGHIHRHVGLSDK